MLRNFLIVLLLLLMNSCSEPSGADQDVSASPYALYLKNNELASQGKRDRDTKSLTRAWTENTRLLQLDVLDTLEVPLYRQRMLISSALYPLDTTIAIAHSYEALAIDEKDSSALADAWFRLGYYYKKAGDPEKAQTYNYKTLQLAKDIGDTLSFAKASVNLAVRLNEIENYGAAQKVATEALAYEPPNNQKLKLYNALASASSGQENYKDKIYWLDKAIALIGNIPQEKFSFSNFLDKSVLTNNKAMGFFRLGENQKALIMLDSLAQDPGWQPELAAKNKRAITEYARILYNLAKVKYHLEMEGPKELIARSEALLTSIGNKRELASLYLQMAGFYQHIDLPKARTLALRALDFARQTSQTDIRVDALRLLTEMSPQPKYYAIEYQQVTDSIKTALNRARDAYARYQYDVDRTRAKNEVLEATTRIQELELRDSRIRSVFLSIIVFVLLGVGTLGYRLIRARARLRQTLEVQKTESAIAKRIHDELANDLYNTMTFVELNTLDTPENKDHLLNNLEDIYKRTRNVSRENAGLPQGTDFKQAVSSLISRYRSKETNILVRGLTEVKWERLEDHQKLALYRVLQELLVNMRKHSKASLVVISFDQKGKKLQVNYKDNGEGIEDDHLISNGGIQNMKSRIANTGGHFQLESAKGKGVKVAMLYG